MRCSLSAALFLSVLGLLSACGGASVTVPPPLPPTVTVHVSPNPVTVLRDATQTFTANVTGTTNTAVTWGILEATAAGTIDSAGVYTPPQNASGTFHVVATNQTGSASGVAAVTVPEPQISLDPPVATLQPGATKSFAATLTMLTDTDVSYAIQESNGGLISSAGLYTAPKLAGIFHVVASSSEESGVTASATITVTTSTSGFTPTGNLQEARGLHTATLLPDNTVLVAFGSNSNSYEEATGYVGLTSVEVYDPGTGKFTEIEQDSGAGIFGHSATLLPNGTVLLAGGFLNSVWDYGGSLADNGAGLYDSATGQFSGTGNMTALRGDHTATLLPNGQVLIAGGSSMDVTGPGLASAELYDPASGTFTPTGTMTDARFMQTATLLKDGKVLIVGGAVSNTAAPLNTAELYDPSTGAFTITGSLRTAREQHTATLLDDGRVLIAGGSISSGGGNPQPTATAEIYDPSTGTFTATQPMAVARSLHTATLLNNGQVLVAGGGNDNSTAEVFDPASGTFNTTGGMEVGRSGHTATLLSNGKVLVAGGGIFSGLASAELYH
ncbi:MAG: kelch repeat-containing protein [Candidatus Acidiferrales bacterium]